MYQFGVTRFLPETLERVEFTVAVEVPTDARFAIDEVVYALAFARKIYPDRDHKAKPEDWAVKEAKQILIDKGGQ